jgi:hypothetical protein
MKVRIEGRHGRANATDMRILLGLTNGTLPESGAGPWDVQGVHVYIKPIAPMRPNQRKRSAHRIMAICNCGVHVPVGRLHQHKCKE